MKAALRTRGLRKAYGRVVALDGLDVEIPPGVVCGLVGPNGAGKTTAFGIAAGLVRPDDGEVDLLGEGPFECARHRGRVALLPQDCELNPHTPVRELLVYYARLQGMTAREARAAADRGLEEVDLGARAASRVRQLSHGMRQRVAVAQALLGEPALVMLDEPTSGLDPHLVVRMREVFRARARRSTLVVSSHVLAELEAVCDHVVFVDRGRLVRQGPLAAVTGRGTSIRVRLAAPADLPTLRDALPELVLRIEGDALVAEAPEGWDAPRLNARVLPFALPLGVIEVRSGSSLEHAYMRDREAEAPDQK